jgi:NTP pyrophosphatase (non-canonical NTP hydrolase)
LVHFRFKNAGQVDSLFKNKAKKEEIADEISDIFFVLLRISQRFNIDLTESLKSKIKKNQKKYPIRKFKGSNKKYNEL